MLTVSILVPAFNEEKTIGSVLQAVAKQMIEGMHFETMVIDDASTDRTSQILKECEELCTQVTTLPMHSGKGAAVIAGLRAATGDYVRVQAADLEYSPAEYGFLLVPVLDHGAEVAIGSRFLAPTWTRVSYFWHKVANRIITFFSGFRSRQSGRASARMMLEAAAGNAFGDNPGLLVQDSAC